MKGIIFGCATPHPPIMIPEIGKGEEHKIQATITAMEKLGKRLAETEPETLVVISPHGNTQYSAMGIATAPYSEGNFDSWGARGINFHFNNDLPLVNCLQETSQKNKIPLVSLGNKIYQLDWGVLVPLYYLLHELKNIAMVPITFSFLPLKTHYAFGKTIQKVAEQCGKRVAIIASGDLSHRLIPGAPAGYDPMGKVFDEKIVNAMARLDYETILNLPSELIDRAGECGLRSLTILTGALDGLMVTPEILSYEGTFGVGYMVASFTIKHLPEEE